MVAVSGNDLFHIWLADHPLAPDRPVTPQLLKSLYAASRKELDLSENDCPVLVGIGSSTTRDREGDIVEKSALDDLAGPVDEGWSTAYIDHNYDSDHILGRLAGQPKLTSGYNKDGVPTAMIEAGVRIFPEEPRAVKTVAAFQRGIKIAYSVGFVPREYDYIRDAHGAPDGGVSFKRVERREISSTPMPANPDSWITGIVKSMRAKGYLPVDDEVTEIAYIARHWTDLDALDGTRIFRIAKAIHTKAVEVSAAGFLQGRQYDALTDVERSTLAQQIAGALSLTSGA